MRDTRAWSKPLVKELADDSVRPLLAPLKPWEICALEVGLSFLDDWEAEHGAPTAEELAEASRKLGLPILEPVSEATERDSR